MNTLSTTTIENNAAASLGAARVMDPAAGAARFAAAKAALASGKTVETNPIAEGEALDPASSAASQGYVAGWAPAKAAPAPAARKAISGGYVALGYDEMDNLVWSNLRNCVVRVKANEVNLATLETIAGLPWVMDQYLEDSEGKGSKLNLSRARSELIAACQAAGKFQDNRVFGAGVWKAKLNGKTELVANSGNDLFTASGAEVTRISTAGVFAESRELGMGPSLAGATEDEVAALSSAVSSWAWRNNTDSLLVLGWLAIAPFAGVLDRRPALNITGPRGSGKTTLLDAIGKLLGSSAIKADGASSTAAGLRQALRHDAVAVVLDEFGDNVSSSLKERERTDSIIAQIRTAYSDSTGEGTVKGTSDGRGATYGVRYSALLSGIVPPPMDAADKTRIAVCSLGTLPRGAKFPELFADDDELVAVGARIRMRMFRAWDAFEATVKLVRQALRSAGRSPRFADTIGTLLAGWYVLMTGEAVDPAGAHQLVGSVSLDSHELALEGASDERECADWLLGYTVQGSAYSVGELIELVADGKKEHARALEQVGLKVQDDQLQVCGSKSVKGLRELFAASKFGNGGWKIVLERVPGAKACRPRFSGVQTPSVAIPLQWLFDTPAVPEQTKLFKS